MRLLALLCITVWLFTYHATAQTAVLDSLQNALKTAREDTNKVRLLNNIAQEQSGEPSIRRATAERAYALAMRLGDKSGAAQAKNHISVGYGTQSFYTEAFHAAEEALILARAADDKYQEGSAFGNIGSTQWRQGNYDAALDSFFKMIAIMEATGYKPGLASALSNVAIVYTEMGNYTSALEYHRKVLSFDEKQGKRAWQAGDLNNIGALYMQQGKHDTALVYFRRALSISTEINDKLNAAACLLNIGESNLRLGRLKEAQPALNEALKLCVELDVKNFIAIGLRLFSELSVARGNFAEAIRYGTKAVALTDSLGARPEKRDAMKALSEAYAGKGDGLKAFALYKDYIALRDSIVNDESTKKAASREAKYTADKKDSEIKMLKMDSENQVLVRNLLLGGLSLVGVVVFLLIVSNNRRKQANALLHIQAAQIQLVNTELSEKNAIIEQERNALEHTHTLLDTAHQQSESLLLNILPAPIAHRLKSGERAIADKFDAVTVLFADIVGFTKLSARTTPEELVQGLNAIFGRFDELARKYGLEKIKTIGDAYMVAGGLPERSHDHAERVAQFALEMQAVMQEDALRSSNGELVQMRIGIHTGAAVAGVIGTSKFSYDLWGDTVNTASRMESHGEAGKIHVSEDVFTALKEKFVFEERGDIEVKGKGLLRTWFLLGAQR